MLYLCVSGQALNGHQLLIISERLWLECGNVNLYITFLLSSERTFGKLAPFVRHKVRPGCEGHVVQVQDLRVVTLHVRGLVGRAFFLGVFRGL